MSAVMGTLRDKGDIQTAKTTGDMPWNDPHLSFNPVHLTTSRHHIRRHQSHHGAFIDRCIIFDTLFTDEI